MAIYFHAVILGILHCVFLLNHYCAKLMEKTNGIFTLPINPVESLANNSFHLFLRWVSWGIRYKRSVLELLKQQNDPFFQENIKLFFGDILELDNSSEHLDLQQLLHCDFVAWRKRAQRTVETIRWHLKITSYSYQDKFLTMLERARIKALKLRAITIPSSVINFTIKYIYHNGGLTRS